MSQAVRRTAFLLTGLLWLLLSVLPPAIAGGETPAKLSGAVTWVHDADTLEVAPHGRVRLLGIEDGRLRLEWISAAEGVRFAEVINEFTDQVRALGPAPWKAGKGAA